MLCFICICEFGLNGNGNGNRLFYLLFFGPSLFEFAGGVMSGGFLYTECDEEGLLGGEVDLGELEKLGKLGKHTRAYESGDVPVAGYFPMGDLLDGAVDGVEERFCLVGSCHIFIGL